MGIVVRAKRVDILDDTINCSFALDFVDAVTQISLNGVYKVDGGDVLVGCTEKGRLCVQGSSRNLDWLYVYYDVSFVDSNSVVTDEQTMNTAQILDTAIGDVIADYSSLVGTGKVGYMIVR